MSFFLNLAPKQNPKPSGSGGSGGNKGGGGGKEWWQEILNNQQSLALIGVAAIGAGWIIMNSSTPSREINWQEFRTSFLEKGDVDRIVIVNRTMARVFLKSDPTVVSDFQVIIMIYYFLWSFPFSSHC